MRHLKTPRELNESKNLNNIPSKEDILSTGDWEEPNYYKSQGSPYGEMYVYQWVHNNENVQMLVSKSGDGFTIIYDDYKERNKLFQGYIESLEDLDQVIRLCRLHEI
jgi:hypothetical protein